MKNAVAELDGDEMTRVLWQVIKDKLLVPFVDLKTEYYDLGLKNRDDSDDEITYTSAQAVRRLGVGVKCATITSNQARVRNIISSILLQVRTVLSGPSLTARYSENRYLFPI